ncbi:sulfonylurea receptor, P-loop containing nucleoside triphosphate hydrolase [Artemisia annua]|uniref:Sulfonylurea receptor, P-loop containing nucleoside triphosphate hydrolase n=1 Tax=Artemisia annua TaxID=35608 RepID=A0A2U1P5T0_ARTAN|nr:sulfonylurea receptor, P-loop containing nucleoside triphosphate hydrolase [Artemisia annua]
MESEIMAHVFCWDVKQYFLPSARELIRLAGLCKAPVIQQISGTMSGSTTIISFDEKDRFKDVFEAA